MVFEIRLEPKGWFKRRPDRNRGSHSREKIAQLRLSMEQEGQLQPVGALPDGTLVWGYGRHEAALESGKIQELCAAILDREVSEEEFLALNLTENLIRCDLTDFEKAKGVQALRAANPDLKAKDIAARLHVDPSLVTRWLSLFNCIPAVQEAAAADGGIIGASKWYAISQLEPKEQHEALTRVLNGETRDALEHRGRRQRNGSKGRPRLARMNFRLGNVGVTVAAKELTLEGVIEWLTEILKQAKKAKEEGVSARNFERVLKDKARK